MTRSVRLLPVLILLITTACLNPHSFTFEFPPDEVQKKIREKFPIRPGSDDKEQPPFNLIVSDPRVLLEEGKDKIGLHVIIIAEPAAPKGDQPKLPPSPGPAKPPLPAPPAPPAPEAPKTLTAPKIRFNGTATLYASISYDPSIKAIRVSDPKITKLEIAQLPAEMTEPISRIAEQKMAEKFAQEPIPLENKTELDKVANTFLKSVTVKNGKLIVEIGF